MYIGICEDEKVQLQYLMDELKTYYEDIHEECRIETFQSAEELLFKYEQSLPFDCLFLDIRMGRMDGMTLAADIRKRDRQIPIIFVTGDRDAVFDGYKVGAVRYLLKPIKREQLVEALQYVQDEHCKDTVHIKSQKAEYYCFNYIGEYVKLDKTHIYTLEVNGHYVTIRVLKEHRWASNGNAVSIIDKADDFKEYTFKGTMKGLEEQLDDRRFAKASRSVLVNLEHVESITRTQCVMAGGEIVPISRSCYNDFNQAFIQFYD